MQPNQHFTRIGKSGALIEEARTPPPIAELMKEGYGLRYNCMPRRKLFDGDTMNGIYEERETTKNADDLTSKLLMFISKIRQSAKLGN